MKSAHLTIFFLLIGMSPVCQADIFGRDDRVDILSRPELKEYSRAVAVGVINGLWTDKGNGFSELWADPIDEFMCKDERFIKEKSVSYACTGFLVAEDLLVTAGHCAVNVGEISNSSENYCEAYTWLFDYNSQTDTSNIPNENIYKCKEIIYAIQSEVDGQSHDFALIKLDRKAIDRRPFKLAKMSASLNQSVTMIGHPMGLPMKFAGNARIIKTNVGRSFYTNLDAFSGNSGSPVLNSRNEVVGVLVAGNPANSTYTDQSLRCERYNRCDDLGRNCRALPSNNSSEGFPNTFSEVQNIQYYLDKF
ncbi:MAG: hypothetical protein OHK0056_31680 [Bacteriovoracaceae bacterium]